MLPQATAGGGGVWRQVDWGKDCLGPNSFRFSKDLVNKNKVDSDRGRHPSINFWLPYLHE